MAVTARTFDGKAYLKKLGQIDALRDKMRKNMERGIVAVAGKLSPAERERMLAFSIHEGRGRPQGHHVPGQWRGDKGTLDWQDRHSDHPAVRDDNGGSPRHED
jgi:hypothetical protein